MVSVQSAVHVRFRAICYLIAISKVQHTLHLVENLTILVVFLLFYCFEMYYFIRSGFFCPLLSYFWLKKSIHCQI